MELNKSLFSALKLEKNIIFLTIALIVIVAALNIIATLILMVMEKTRDIGILIAMGATSPEHPEDLFPAGLADRHHRDGPRDGRSGSSGASLANTFKLIKVPVDIYQIIPCPVPHHASRSRLYKRRKNPLSIIAPINPAQIPPARIPATKFPVNLATVRPT